MIIYTTGTGNSKSVARQIASHIDDATIVVAEKLIDADVNVKIPAGERLIFVMPIHSWGPALMMMRLIDKVKFDVDKAWAVFVCGDMCGNADKVFAKALSKKGVTLEGAYSVQMPNNYILMKGFGIDTEELVNAKLAEAPARIMHIVEAILSGDKDANLYVRGGMPSVKTGLVYKLFGKYAVKKVAFRALDKCVGCGHCADVCPTKNITMQGGRPVWGNDCVQCVACIHRCPHGAIEYGTVSVGQGRYRHPDVEKEL